MRYALIVTYYQNEKADLLADCLLPLALEIREKFQLPTLYVQRHWKFGPHVRLCCTVENRQQAQEIESYARPVIERYLTAAPSTLVLDEAAYAKQSERLGTQELEPGPYVPLRPDNTVCLEETDGRSDLLGGEESLLLKEELLSAAMPFFTRLLSRTSKNKEQRLSYVLQLMTMMAQIYPNGGIMRGHLSYRSHLEDYLFDFDKQGKVRSLFQAKYAPIKDEVVALMKNAIDDFEPFQYKGSDEILGEWADVLKSLWDRAYVASEAQVITEDATHLHEVARGVNEQAEQKWAWNQSEYSDFHNALRSMNDQPTRIGTIEFSTYRWIVNMFYTLLQLLDVAPQERYFICYVLAESTESILGMTWKEIMEYARTKRQNETK